MINFDGVNDWVDLRAGNDVLNIFNGAAGGTIMGWIDLDTNAVEMNFVSYSINNAGVPTALSRFSIGTSEIAPFGLGTLLRSPDTDPIDASDDTTNAGALGTSLLHVAVVADLTGSVSFFRNGVLTETNAVGFGSGTFTNSGSASGALMADDNGVAPLFADGQASDVRAYNRILSENEIATIYAARGHDNIVSGLMARYPMVYQSPGTIYQGSPQVASATNTTRASAATSHDVVLPATINKYDLLLIHLGVHSGNTIIIPVDWSQLFQVPNISIAGDNTCWVCAVKIADGAEGGTTVTFTSTETGSMAAQTYRITDWNGSITNGIAFGTASGPTNSTNPNPPTLSPSWGNTQQNTLWLALSVTNDDGATYTAAPAGYTNLLSAQSGAGIDLSVSVGSARLTSATATQDPGTFTTDITDTWAANTVAIRPEALVVDVSESRRDGTANGGPIASESVISKRRRYL